MSFHHHNFVGKLHLDVMFQINGNKLWREETNKKTNNKYDNDDDDDDDDDDKHTHAH